MLVTVCERKQGATMLEGIQLDSPGKLVFEGTGAAEAVYYPEATEQVTSSGSYARSGHERTCVSFSAPLQ